jgi:hypothetical protein
VLSKRVLRVRAKPLLGVLGRLLRVALETISATLVVDVAGGLARLRLGLLLRLGGLAASVGCGHDEVVGAGERVREEGRGGDGGRDVRVGLVGVGGSVDSLAHVIL